MNSVVLSELGPRINAEHSAAVAHARTALKRARAAGELLLQAKAQCQHGEWLPWLRANCPIISPRTVQGYMRLARYCLENPNDVENIEDRTLRDALAQTAVPTEEVEMRNRCVFGEVVLTHLDEWAQLERRRQALKSELDDICCELDEGFDVLRWPILLQQLADIARSDIDSDFAVLRLRMQLHLGLAFRDGMTLAESLAADPEMVATQLGVDAAITLEERLSTGASMPNDAAGP